MKILTFLLCLSVCATPFAQQTASIECVSRALVFFSDFEDEINFTTYDGSSGLPLRESIPHGFRWSAEFRPRANQPGVYEADFFAMDDEFTISMSGSATISLPKTDQDANSIPDIVQPNRPGDTTFSGTGQMDWPQKASFPITGRLTRETNSDRGAWSMIFNFPSGPKTFEGDFRIPVVFGTADYVRGSQNLAFVRLVYIDEYEDSQVFSGSTSYKVISATQTKTSEYLITGPDQETYRVPASTWTRSGNQYRAAVSIPDGWPATSWPDFCQWVCTGTDDNDSDKDGIPDITDSGVTTGVQPGRLDLGFNPALSGGSRVQTLAVQPDGKILVGGSFANVNGLTRNGIARLNPDGTIDTEFAPLLPLTTSDSMEIMHVWAILLRPDGKILLGGKYLPEEDLWRGRVVQLDQDGQLDRTFTSGEVTWIDGLSRSYFSLVECLAVQNSGDILIGGLASYNWLFPDLPRPYQGLARLLPDGSLDWEFDVALPGYSEIHALAIQDNGQILIGGYFSEVNGQACFNLARLNQDGQLDTSFTPKLDWEGQVHAIIIQKEGKILLGGSFTNLEGSVAHGIARLNADGSRDTTFNFETEIAFDFGLAGVYALAVQPDGKILVGGEFTKVDGIDHIGLARLNPDGSLDKTFVAEAGSTKPIAIIFPGATEPHTIVPGTFPSDVHGFALPGDGTVLVGGSFNLFNGEPRSGLARVSLGNAPCILTHPLTQAAGMGSNVTFQVLAYGKGTLKYQWRFNGTDMAGATGDSLLLRNLQVPNAGDYAVLVTDTNGSVLSRTATLTVLVPEGGKLWHFAVGTEIVSSPAIDRFGTIYFGSSTKFYALDAPGQKKWEFTAGGKIESSPAIGPDGTIYFGSMDSKVYALNRDGTQKWAFTTGGAVSNSPALGADGTVYVGSQDFKLYAINPDGTMKWQVATGNRIYSSPALGVDGTVYVGSSDQRLYAVKPDGSLKWTFNAGGILRSSPAIGIDGTVYIGGDDKKLYAIRPDGVLKWTYTVGGAIRSSPSIGPDGTIFLGADDKKLHAIYPDGRKRWEYLATGAIQSSVLIGAEGTLFVGAYNRFVAVKPEGTLEWSYVAGGKINSSPVIGLDGSIYFGSADGKLYAIKNSESLATSPWPMFRQNAQHTASTQILVSTEAAGTLDPSFLGVTLVEGYVHTMVLQADGKILVAGHFSEINGVNRTSIARLHADGTVDESFTPRLESPGGLAEGVYAIAVQPDGKVLVGGEFTRVNGEERRNLVRLTTDGLVDQSFQVFTWDWVRAITRIKDGRILVSTGGYILRLSASGVLDSDFFISIDPNEARLIVEQTDGRILVGFHGVTRFFADGVWDASFMPGRGSKTLGMDGLWFETFVLHPDGRIYARNEAGVMRLFPDGSADLGYINQTLTNAPNSHAMLLLNDNQLLLTTSDGVRRLRSDGTIDLSFALTDSADYMGVQCLVEQPDGRILLGGDFGIIRVFGGTQVLSPPAITTQPGSRVATVGTNVFLTVSATGYPPPTYQWQHEGIIIPGATNAYLSLLDARTNRAGRYSVTAMNGLGAVTSDMATLTVVPARPGSLDMTFNTELDQSAPANGDIAETIALQSDGRLLVAGWFSGSMDQELKVIRLQPDGRLDSSFQMDAVFDDSIPFLALHNDGKVVIGVRSSGMDDQIVRLHSNGSLDTSFDWGSVAVDGSIRALAMQNDGKVLVSSLYENWWQSNGNLFRLNTNGQRDFSFSLGSDLDGPVNAMVVQNDGKIVIGGGFGAVDGTPRAGLARLNSDGRLDAIFNPNLELSPVYSLALQSDGKLLACGAFVNQDGYEGLSIVRLNPDGSFDLSFSQNLFIEANLRSDDPITSMALQGDGKILVAGLISLVNGIPRKGLARLQPDGTLDHGFCALIENGEGGLADVGVLALQQDGKIVVAGSFSQIDGIYKNGLARLHGRDTPPGLPALLNIPTFHTINVDQYLRLEGYASSYVPPSYQWQLNGTNLPGATNLVLLPHEVQISGVGSYALVLSNPAGVVTSLVATVEVHNPFIAQWPGSWTANVGESVTFQITAGGTSPLHYQWWFQATNPVGVDSSQLVLKNLQMYQTGDYRVVVSNPIGSVASGDIRLTVLPTLPDALNARQLTWSNSPGRPWSSQVNTSHDGQAAARSAPINLFEPSWLETKVTGPGTISFYWKVSSETNRGFLKFLINGAERAMISGEIDWHPMSFAVPAGLNTLHWLYVKDSFGFAGQDSGWLDEVAFVGQPPLIEAPPQNQFAAPGMTVVFAVTASGLPPLSYRWLFNGTEIPAATNAMLRLTNVTLAQAGDYSVTVSNNLGVTNSLPATLTLVDLALAMFDDFEGGIDSSQWSGLSASAAANNYGGSVSGTNSLWFGGYDQVRFARTRPLSIAWGGLISFQLRLADKTSWPWEAPNLPEKGVVLEYSTNNGAQWITMATCDNPIFKSWTSIQLAIPEQARSTNTVFRWRQQGSAWSDLDHWALDDVQVLLAALPSPTLTLPQIANNKFSLSISTIKGQTYLLEYTDSLPSSQWIPLLQIIGDGSIMRLEDPTPVGSQRYYRVRLE